MAVALSGALLLALGLWLWRSGPTGSALRAIACLVLAASTGDLARRWTQTVQQSR